MNLLKKQGFFNSITLYTGTALGFLNLIILFQRAFTAEEVGFFLLMTSVCLLYTQFAAIGFNSIITRYFPYFKTQDGNHQGFPSYVFKATSIGFLVVTVFYIFGKEFVIYFKEGNDGSSYYSQYYYLIIPLSLFIFWYSLAETFARTSFHNILPSFLREVLLKVFTTIGVCLVYFKWLNYEQFIYWYIIATATILLVLLAYLKKLDLLRFKTIELSVKEKSPEILRYGFYSMLAGSSITMIQSIGTIMIKIYTNEGMVGYYGTLAMMGVVISLPARAFGITSYQLIADAWKTNDLKKINKIYSKTSLVQFMLGTLFLIGLVSNWHNILILLAKPEFAEFYYVFIVVALGFLVDITGGLNGIIILFSKTYKFMMPILLTAVVLCAFLNMIFIPRFGILGAAVAYCLTTLALNFTYWLYLLLKYGLQPFSFAFVKLIMIGVIVFFVGAYIPIIDNFFFDVLLRSGVVSIIYISAVYILNISPDINEAINQVFNKLKSK